MLSVLMAPSATATELDDGNVVPVSLRRLGRYELLRPIASGGMAAVYLARVRGAAGFERLFAVKCCHPHLREEVEFTNMLLDEARIAARIHHPNVVATTDIGDEKSLYLVMEYVRGGTLSALIRASIRSGEPVPAPVALRIASDALAGLHAAHELSDSGGASLQLVHRDVSPQNILIGVDGVARITDFGVAKAAARLTSTAEGTMKGKLAYMSPEQLDRSPIDRRTDVFAIGVVLWETLTGRRLYAGETPSETVNLVLRGFVEEPSSVRPDLATALDDVVLRALAKDPDERYQSAEEMIEAIEQAGVPIASPRAVGAFVAKHLSVQLEAADTMIREVTAQYSSKEEPTEPEPDAPATPSSSGGWKLGAGVLTGLLLGAAMVGGFMMWSGQDSDPLPSDQVQTDLQSPPAPEPPVPEPEPNEPADEPTELESPPVATPPADTTADSAEPDDVETPRRRRRPRARREPREASPPTEDDSEYHPAGL